MFTCALRSSRCVSDCFGIEAVGRYIAKMQSKIGKEPASLRVAFDVARTGSQSRMFLMASKMGGDAFEFVPILQVRRFSMCVTAWGVVTKPLRPIIYQLRDVYFWSLGRVGPDTQTYPYSDPAHKGFFGLSLRRSELAPFLKAFCWVKLPPT